VCPPPPPDMLRCLRCPPHRTAQDDQTPRQDYGQERKVWRSGSHNQSHSMLACHASSLSSELSYATSPPPSSRGVGVGASFEDAEPESVSVLLSVAAWVPDGTLPVTATATAAAAGCFFFRIAAASDVRADTPPFFERETTNLMPGSLTRSSGSAAFPEGGLSCQSIVAVV
jgi:hypothetical protein